MTNWKGKLTIFLLLGAVLFAVASPVVAQDEDRNDPSGIVVEPPEDSGLLQFELPTFFDAEGARNFTLFSYLSTALNLILLGLVILWVVLSVRAGFDWLRSEGSADAIQGARTRFIAVFSSIGILFIFYILLILVGSFLGIGANTFSWPKALSRCTDETTYFFQLELYFGSDSDYDLNDLCFDGDLKSVLCGALKDTCFDDCAENAGYSSSAIQRCAIICEDDYDRCIENIE